MEINFYHNCTEYNLNFSFHAYSYRSYEIHFALLHNNFSLFVMPK
jgi:hypothetical protein